MNSEEVHLVVRAWEVVRGLDEPKSASQIAALAGLTKSHTRMILTTFKAKGLVEHGEAGYKVIKQGREDFE